MYNNNECANEVEELSSYFLLQFFLSVQQAGGMQEGSTGV